MDLPKLLHEVISAFIFELKLLHMTPFHATMTQSHHNKRAPILQEKIQNRPELTFPPRGWYIILVSITERICFMKEKIPSTLFKSILIFGVSAAVLIATILLIRPHTKTLDYYNGLMSTDFERVDIRNFIEGDDDSENTVNDALEIVSTEPEDGYFHVKLKGNRPGTQNVLITAHHEDKDGGRESAGLFITVTESGNLYTGEYTFNGDEFLYLAFGMIYLFIAIMLLYWRRKTRKAMHFSYKSILDLGIAFYFLVQALVLIPFTLFGFQHPDNPGRIYVLVNGYTLTVIAILSVVPLLIFALMMTISNIGLLLKEGKSWKNILGILLSGAFLLGITGLAILTYFTLSSNLSFDPKDSAVVIIRGIIASLIVYFESNLFSTLLHCQLAGRHKPKYDKDFIIILGCGIKEDGTLYPLLKGRADRAIEFAQDQVEATGRKPYFIPSGGQGPDECMPEGEAIKNYLVFRGIPEELILPETKSVNTLQNMQFSKQIIDAKNPDGNILFSTTNYHVFRSGILAEDVGLNADGMGARTKWYFWPNALIREFIGMLARHWKLHLVVVTTLVLQAVLFGNFQWFIDFFL